MITASHNPPQYNGIKIFNHDSVSIDEKTQDRIEKTVESGNFKPAEWRDVGRASHVNKSFHYAKMILDKVELQKKWRIIVDPGCGATYTLAPEILTKLGCRMTAFNAQPDGFFPARSSEPNEESLESLTNLVREFNADVGIAYDGDGDRVAFIDEKGDFADFDLVLAAYAGYVAKKEKSGIMVTNVEASMCFEKTVTAHHGKVVRTKVGDVYLSEMMKRHRAVFGGEPCGAWIHPQFHYCPDGILSSVLLLKALEDEKKKLSEFIAKIPKFPTLREKVACRNEEKYNVVEEIGERLKSVFSRYIEFSKIDGFRLTLDEGWILVRASGTEPLIRLTVEGESLKTAKNMMDKAWGFTKETIRRKNP
jgi:phosphoglucosamine mutase